MLLLRPHWYCDAQVEINGRFLHRFTGPDALCHPAELKRGVTRCFQHAGMQEPRQPLPQGMGLLGVRPTLEPTKMLGVVANQVRNTCWEHAHAWVVNQ